MSKDNNSNGKLLGSRTSRTSVFEMEMLTDVSPGTTHLSDHYKISSFHVNLVLTEYQ